MRKCFRGFIQKKYYGGWRWGMAAWEKYNKNKGVVKKYEKWRKRAIVSKTD